jgi:hypothetical protein
MNRSDPFLVGLTYFSRILVMGEPKAGLTPVLRLKDGEFASNRISAIILGPA